MNSYPILRQLVDAPITDTTNPTFIAPITDTSTSLPFTAVIHPILLQSFHPSKKPTLIVRPRKFLRPPGHFLATKRLKHNNEVCYKTLHQYNDLLKSHEAYLDSILLANSFHNLSFNTSTSKSCCPFAYKKLSSHIFVLQPYKIALNQPLDANKHIHPPQIMALSSPSCASASLDNANTSTTDDPSDYPDNVISDMSIKDNNDAISEKSIEDNNDDPIPIDELKEPLTPINDSNACDNSSNFHDEPPIRIIGGYPDPFALFHVSPLHQHPSSPLRC